MAATGNRGESSAHETLGPNVFVQSKAGRKGIPLTRSFDAWVKAALATRRKDWTEVNILIVNEAEGRQFNAQFRHKNYPTNVLSFPYEPLPNEPGELLGDIVFCAPVVAREAAEQGKPLRHHYAHLTVHGVLHLLGFDHIEQADADRMEMLERQILATLGIPDPYQIL